MQSYIARQAIFGQDLHVVAYELLYRASADSKTAAVTDGDYATRSLLSNAMMVFGLSNLTDGRVAYVNFTEKLIHSDFILLTSPRQVVVEILEDIPVTERLARRLKELKDRKYRLALDDYTGNPAYDCILPLIDIVKVDFRQTTPAQQEQIAAKYRKGRMTLLAEKVETREEYERARRLGYRKFQGYFFERPTNLKKDMPDINTATYVRLLRELNKADVELQNCAELIRTDAELTYRLLKRVQTLQYYRGRSVQLLEHAVAYMGIDELYHWVVLILARDYNHTLSDETVREAYLRGIFTERLLEHSAYASKKTAGFLLGMFSLMDVIMNRPMAELLEEVALPTEVKEILLGTKKSPLEAYLAFAIAQEQGAEGEIPPLNMDANDLVDLYMQSIKDTDRAFRSGL